MEFRADPTVGAPLKKEGCKTLYIINFITFSINQMTTASPQEKLMNTPRNWSKKSITASPAAVNKKSKIKMIIISNIMYPPF